MSLLLLADATVEAPEEDEEAARDEASEGSPGRRPPLLLPLLPLRRSRRTPAVGLRAAGGGCGSARGGMVDDR